MFCGLVWVVFWFVLLFWLWADGWCGGGFFCLCGVWGIFFFIIFFESVSLIGKIKLFSRILLGWAYLRTLAPSSSVSEKLGETTLFSESNL